MTNAVQNFVQALREELKQFGELLALLDEQREAILGRATNEIVHSIAELHTQGAVVQRARQHRERRQQALAGAVGLPKNAACPALLARVPVDYQPLLAALIDENRELPRRVQQRSRQNHYLLARSIKTMQQLIGSLAPSGNPLFGEQNAAGANKVSPPRALEAVGS